MLDGERLHRVDVQALLTDHKPVSLFIIGYQDDEICGFLKLDAAIARISLSEAVQTE